MTEDRPVVRARARPQRAVADATRRRLLDSGRRIFARDGFARANTQDIVDAAEVAPTALYHHFGSKAGLFVAVGQEVYEIFVGFLADALDGVDGYEDRLRALVAASARLHRRDPTLAPMAISVQLEVRRDPQLRTELATSLKSFQMLAEDVARTASAELLDRHGLRALSLTVVTLLNGLSSVGATLRDPDEFVRTTAALDDVLF